MRKEKIQILTMLLLIAVLGGVVIFFLADRLIPVLAPFIIAWCVAMAVRGPAGRLSRGAHIPERVLRVLMAVFVTLLAFGIIALFIWQLSALLWRILSDIGEGGGLLSLLESLSSPSLPFFGDIFPEELSARLDEALGSLLEGIVRSLGEAVTSWVSLVPGAIFFLLVTVIALVYFSLDLERINKAVGSVLPKKTAKYLKELRAAVFSTAAKYLRSYLIILCITFLLMLAGFFIIGVEDAPLIALIVAFLDILPIIGVGTVLVPWSIFELALGRMASGVGLLLLFLVNTVVRQLVEPKIVGRSLDLHPALTLVLIYSGYALFGGVGLVLVPVLSVLIGALLKNKSTAQVNREGTAEGEDT